MKRAFMLFLTIGLLIGCISFTAIEAKATTVDSGTCGANLTWTLDDQGTLTISGTGNMTNYASQGAPWFSIKNRSKIKKVVIEEGITSIGNYAFANLPSITEITTPSSVTKIGERAFLYCESLQSFVVPNGVRTIPAAAFSNCTSLTTVVIPDSVQSFGAMAFNRCSSLEYLIIPEGVTELPQSMFDRCSGLEYVSIPTSVTYIHTNAFDTCGNLWDIYYAGTKAQFDRIGVYNLGNDQLGKATIHYSSKAPCRNHAYGSWTKVGDSTHKRICSVCQKEETANHTWNSGTVTKAASCKETGVKTYTCTGCNATKTETIAKTTDHKYGSWTKVNDTTHKHTCSVCYKEETANHTWNSGSVTKQATCKEEGVKTYTCTACNTTKTESIAKATTHTYGNWVKVNDTTHKHTCPVCSKEETANHSWNGGSVTKKATCKEAGVKTYTCTACNSTKTESIAKLTTHTYDHACDTDCNVCGVTRSTTHNYKTSWSKDKTNHWHECSVCKDKKDVAAHEPGAAATETTAQTCTICAYVIKEALGHTHNFGNTWLTDDTNHWRTCACGEKADEAAHTWDGTACSVCGTQNPTPPTEPGTEPPTEPATEPSTEPELPTTGTPTQPDPTVPADDKQEGGGFPIWIPIVVAVLGGGVAVVVIILKKKR